MSLGTFLSAALSTKANIEMFRQEQKNYDEWAKAMELRKGIHLAILDKCNGQVKKALFAAHRIDQIESLTCKVTPAQQYVHRCPQNSGSSSMIIDYTSDPPPSLQGSGHHNLSLSQTQFYWHQPLSTDLDWDLSHPVYLLFWVVKKKEKKKASGVKEYTALPR